jgi:catechol 2,3-dioxygenase-like lactoylglutathione lyase family enzyme
MSLAFSNITFDCTDPAALADFWAKALDRTIGDRSDDTVALPASASAGDPPLFFVRVPERKTAKNRIHLDLVTSNRADEVARLVGLGATSVADGDEQGYRWTVLLDPEGNELCVVEQAADDPN